MSGIVPDTENSHHRNRSIRLAVLTSLLSKFGTIILRLISIPIAVRALGMELFGVYTTITLALSLIDIFHVGIGPTLTKELTKAVAKGDREREKTVFTTSVLVSTLLTVIAGSIAVSVFYFVPITTLFGESFSEVQEEMYAALWVGLAISLTSIFSAPFEMSRDGYMETRFTNSWGAAGNVIAAMALILGVSQFDSIIFLLLAVNGVTTLAKVGNAIHFLIQRPYLLPRFSLFRKNLVRPLVIDSSRFSITYILAAAAEYHFMVFMIGRFVGPEAVAVFNVMITIHLSVSGILSMFTRPYWPAIMDAYERNDLPWIQQSSRKLILVGLAFGACAAAGLISLGPVILPLWAGADFYDAVGEGFTMDRVALAAFSSYFILHIWRYIHQTLALGVCPVARVSYVVIGEAFLIATVAFIALITTKEITFVYFAMAASILCVSGWIYPSLFRKEVGKSTTRPENEATQQDRKTEQTPPEPMLQK